ncbi:MAG: hypothetical protein ACI9VR_001446 [Cognaticolwellia sp.]
MCSTWSPKRLGRFPRDVTPTAVARAVRTLFRARLQRLVVLVQERAAKEPCVDSQGVALLVDFEGCLEEACDPRSAGCTL